MFFSHVALFTQLKEGSKVNTDKLSTYKDYMEADSTNENVCTHHKLIRIKYWKNYLKFIPFHSNVTRFYVCGDQFPVSHL